MADNASRRGATDLATPLMILAALVLGGFFYWLTAQVSAERELDIVEGTTPTDDASSAPTVAATDLEMDATPYVGQRITLGPLAVASLLGTQGFWVELPSRNPFLISLSPALRADSVTVAMGDRATVTGTLLAINDSVLNAWTGSGSITDNDRIVAEFATHFIEAETVRATAGPGGGTP